MTRKNIYNSQHTQTQEDKDKNKKIIELILGVFGLDG